MIDQPADLKDFDPQKQAAKAVKTALEYRNAPERAMHLVTEAVKKAERNKGALRKVISDLATLVRLVRAWFATSTRLRSTRSSVWSAPRRRHGPLARRAFYTVHQRPATENLFR